MWESFASDLSSYVQGYGWEFDESTKKYKCDGCVEIEDDESPCELAIAE
jgi:hypothetical protein